MIDIGVKMSGEVGMVIVVLSVSALGGFLYVLMRWLYRRDARAWKKERY